MKYKQYDSFYLRVSKYIYPPTTTVYHKDIKIISYYSVISGLGAKTVVEYLKSGESKSKLSILGRNEKTLQFKDFRFVIGYLNPEFIHLFKNDM